MRRSALLGAEADGADPATHLLEVFIPEEFEAMQEDVEDSQKTESEPDAMQVG